MFHIPRIAGNCCVHPCNEHWFGHAVSRDLDTWETLDPVLSTEPANYFESSHIWAPFVFSGADADYMFYSGLSSEPSQVIAFAVTTDPQLKAWSRNPGNPLIPIEGFDWHFRNSSGHIRHGRDPHVVKVGSHFLLAYTTMHSNGCPCVGGMVSDDLRKWDDIGPILYRPFDPAPWMPESVNIQSLPDGRWVLIPSVSPGLEYYNAGDPHAWHGSEPESITYLDGPSDQPLGLEVLLRDDCAGKWLTAYFEMSANRLFIGELNIHAAPWSLKRITNPQELAAWSGRFAI